MDFRYYSSKEEYSTCKDSCEMKLSFEGTTVAIVFSFSSRNHLEEFTCPKYKREFHWRRDG